MLHVQVALDDAVAQVRTLSKNRSDLDGIVSKCRDSIAAIDTKLPALNEEKKAVVAARKFKEAAKVQADIKQLSEEKYVHIVMALLSCGSVLMLVDCLQLCRACILGLALCPWGA